MAQTDTEKIRGFLESEAQKLGFDAIGVVRPGPDSDFSDQLKAFVKAGHHATMAWMKETATRRGNPLVLWPETRSIIMLAVNYGPETNPMDELEQRNCGTVSVYARNRDYHDVIKGRLKTLASKLVARTGADVKVFVDTAPVMEKPLAAHAGLGWQGKHTNLVSREFGSWLFLGSIFTTLELEEDTAGDDHCGSCRRCLDICPTNAFPAPYRIDARRCISYLTIEHKGPIPLEFRKSMGNRIYGCDDCLSVCPWNRFAKAATEAKLAAPEKPQSHLLRDFLELDDAAFRARFSGSPVKRIGRNRFVRNCLVAAGNSELAGLVPLVRSLCDDDDAVVADAAQWAMAELERQ